MIYLLCSICASVGIFIAFRLFQNHGVNTGKAIMLNYLVAAITGLVFFDVNAVEVYTRPWFTLSLLLGLLFYTIFRVMAMVTQQNGMAISSLATKMSLVIPVTAGLTLLDESFTYMKLAGIVCGLAAVLLSTGTSNKSGKWILPLVLFAGSGLVDTSIKLFQAWQVVETDFPAFISVVFVGAFITALIHHSILKSVLPGRKDLIGGISLALVNFASLYFLMLTLALPGWESSVVFPINNLGIILGSTLVAVLLFKESLSIRAMAGLLLAFTSIATLYIFR